ncbi:YlbF family regulator [Streptosporangium saharense]|uniref:Cell fate (Sporulation/competence/biofilm development) regulator YlbF (YheA/YmcA/DUF963 family) n=1 Tax=Streptosporangium saharense TaxID=1706840 RepID=A0A7W7QSV1_9ACTN|nr:YlbF family regulator [Streptosporangium saharense]MBB4919116.1 cell fate (sporulation/competence/biofilm development) regulator YlbF (YheA/YmcA/DUF963 family) [Streptosporangium saharense]
MTRIPLWKAIEEQSVVWASIPLFRRFADHLPRNAPQRAAGLPGLLQTIQASASWAAARPLRLGFAIPWLLEQLEKFGGLPGPKPQDLGEVLVSWLNAAQRVESAHRDTVAWLRSRLPGYPALPAPQLAPGTPLTTVEFSWRLTWAPQERTRGLQLQSDPPNAGKILQATDSQQRGLNDTAHSLAAAFERTEEWIRLSVAADALDGDARAKLQNTRVKLRQRLAEKVVTAYEPNLAMPRDEYRQLVLSEEIKALEGVALEYANAFDAAEQLVEMVASDIFGQISVYGNSDIFTKPQDLDIQPGDQQTVTFTLADDSWPDVGMVAWLDDPFIVDALHITGINFNHNEAAGMVQRVTGVVLEETAAAWRGFSS